MQTVGSAAVLVSGGLHFPASNVRSNTGKGFLPESQHVFTAHQVLLPGNAVHERPLAFSNAFALPPNAACPWAPKGPLLPTQ